MKRAKFVLLAAAWLLAASSGTLAMLRREYTPGAAAHPPEHWPASSALPHSGATLIMFAHRRCPCTRASLDELALIMAAAQGRVTARVLFLQPSTEPADWVRTDTWRSAETIPGVIVCEDRDGAEARRFGAFTSGETLLYDAGGRLVFAGGITGSRGHEGDNAGRSAVTAFLAGQPAPFENTPVYGCSLPLETNCRGSAP